MRAAGLLLAALMTGCAGPVERDRSGPAPIPDHPDALEYEPRVLSFPDPAEYRHELSTGDVVYVVEDHSLPLVKIDAYSPAGDFLLDDDQAGLATLTAGMLTDGGTEELTPAEVDERLEFLATGISFSIGSVGSRFSVDTLTANLEESLDLAFDMLVEPRWDTERLQIAKNRLLEQMRRRNDDTRLIEPREWSNLLYGEDFFVNDRATAATVERVDPEAMETLSNRAFSRGQLILAVSGDVDTPMIKKLLEQQLGRLPPAEPLPAVPDAPDPAQPGLYGVDKPDVTQTRVSLGHPGLMRGHPDEFALAVMNEILGGGGFTSRIVSRVRSDEGLAYSAGSSVSLGRFYPGQFRVAFQSKNRSVAQALAIVLEEIDRIRAELPTPEELKTAKESQIAFLADLFSSASRKANRFAADEVEERDPDYWRDYEANVRSVTAGDVRRVAAEHLHTEQLRFLLVGNLDEALDTAETRGVEELVGQPLRRIPLKDPLTLEPIEP